MNYPPRVSLARLAGESREQLQGAVQQALDPLGGIELYVKPGNKVLLKPNQTLFMSHQTGATTSAPLVRVLIEKCFHAGAKEVWVAEAAGHAQSSRDVMNQTGMAAAVNGSGAHLIYLDEIAEKVFDFGGDAGALRYMPAPELMERADVIINVPKAKTHFMDPISCACKNWIGVMPMAYRLHLQQQGAPYYRGNALLLRRFPPTLNVVDGGWAGEGQGPGANDAFWWGWIVVSADPVATDLVVADLFGLDWRKIGMAQQAAQVGVGTFDLDRIERVGEPSDPARCRAKPADPSLERYPCRVLAGDGVNMEGTLGHWKTIADGWLKHHAWQLFTLRGTPTFMFGAVEDPHFEQHLAEGPYVVLDDAALEQYKYDRRVTFVPGSPVPQSYMQQEMVAGMGFAGIYQMGMSVQQMINKFQAVGSRR